MVVSDRGSAKRFVAIELAELTPRALAAAAVEG